jgi:uncharacterized protein (DUF697 family)
VEKEISEKEKDFIRAAHRYLESPSFLNRLTEIVGSPLERGMTLLPEKVQKKITQTTNRALQAALKTALISIHPSQEQEIKNFPESQPIPLESALKSFQKSRYFHNAATTLSGTTAGFFGIAALPFELPMTTTLILRSIAQVAKNFGADLSDQKTQLDCLFVLSAGPNYYTSRVTYAVLTREAVTYFTAQGARNLAEILGHGSSPIVVKLLAQIAARFKLVVSEKFIAQSIPVSGAVAGGMINLAFTEHFNQVAKYHFGLQALEKLYGKEQIESIYQESSSAQRA